MDKPFLFLAFRDRIAAGSEKKAIALRSLLGLEVFAAGHLTLISRIGTARG